MSVDFAPFAAHQNQIVHLTFKKVKNRNYGETGFYFIVKVEGDRMQLDECRGLGGPRTIKAEYLTDIRFADEIELDMLRDSMDACYELERKYSAFKDDYSDHVKWDEAQRTRIIQISQQPAHNLHWTMAVRDQNEARDYGSSEAAQARAYRATFGPGTRD